MRETGLISRLKTKWFLRSSQCDGDNRDFTFVGLEEIKPTVIAYVIGLILSISLLAIEILSVPTVECFSK